MGNRGNMGNKGNMGNTGILEYWNIENTHHYSITVPNNDECKILDILLTN
jgi:hypothetical protein